MHFPAKSRRNSLSAVATVRGCNWDRFEQWAGANQGSCPGPKLVRSSPALAQTVAFSSTTRRGFQKAAITLHNSDITLEAATDCMIYGHFRAAQQLGIPWFPAELAPHAAVFRDHSQASPQILWTTTGIE
jgi:hypothetical protein